MDIIERLNDDELFMDAIDDAIAEIVRLRQEIARERKRIAALIRDGSEQRSWAGAKMVKHLVPQDLTKK